MIKDAPYLSDLGANSNLNILITAAMTLATETFRWTEAHCVHIAELDEQHKQLIATVNELDQALRERQGDSALDSVLQKLFAYSIEHFASEERLMMQYDFPGLSTHRAQHEEFRRKLTGFLDAFHAGKSCVPVSVLLFMQTWLKEHLLKTDQQYSAYLNARGVL